jgi:hypothetical protein
MRQLKEERRGNHEQKVDDSGSGGVVFDEWLRKIPE